jgi:hypothetical protein
MTWDEIFFVHVTRQFTEFIRQTDRKVLSLSTIFFMNFSDGMSESSVSITLRPPSLFPSLSPHTL